MQSKRSIPSQFYDTDYFLNRVQGGDLFIQSQGTLFVQKHYRIFALAGDLENKLLLDMGCGRGDFVIGAARKGAIATGCDFSPAAISLAKGFSARFLDESSRVSFDLLDNPGFNTSYPDEYFDIVSCSDVIEHLDDDRVGDLLREAYRVLKAKGRFIVHTGPNLLYLKYGRYVDFWFTYYASFLIKSLKPFVVKKEAEDLHVNEQTVLSLKRRLRRHGFRGKVWAEQGYTDQWNNSRSDIKALRSLWRRVHKWGSPVLCSEIYARCGKAEE